ncbi:hypothetical protein BJ138DRAFT_1117362 [Hygrophoropsis aurantiaca]|uniref:Uncharacterized protein n=1 Tax=Hygrophoropsis aurantiaca TaxID=72124 RepID=A0ACB7ZZH3_9AGAM|nr:hypothetical protein BJ138DRAFT_1117362 [Hygrophoropsis aurantiaca]
MFARTSALLLVPVFALAAIAMPAELDTRDNSQCNTGSIQCCDSTQSSTDASTTFLLGLLGVVLGPVTGLIGLDCTPVSIIGTDAIALASSSYAASVRMKYASRKYVDLIRQTTAKWANWDPPIPIKVGSYGTINGETGELDVEGNIYDATFEEIWKTHFPNINLKDHQPKVGEPDEDFVVSSVGVRRRDLKIGPEIGLTGVANVSLKGEWQFATGRRGALLVMHKPRQTYLPPGELLKPLYNIPELKDKYIVTSVFSCPAYSIYLSDKSGEKVSLALVANGPIPTAPIANIGAELALDWWTDSQTSFLRKAASKKGDYSFTPLYALKRKLPVIRRLFRDSPVPEPTGDDFWIDVPQPWDPLDEDGELDPVYDGSDDEDDAGFDKENNAEE